MRIVLDTCVLVAAIRSGTGASSLIVDLASQENRFFQIVLNEALASQYEDVIYRAEHRNSEWSDQDLYALLQSLLVPAHWAVTNFSYRPLLRDVGDELVLEAAINGQANTIVTFNLKDFEPAERYGIRTVRPQDFLLALADEGWVNGQE